MAITSYIMPLLGGAVLMTTCYGLGRFGYSIGWIWFFIVLNFIKSKLWKQREKRLMSLRQAALQEKEVVLSHLQDLPAWVQFPDTERVEWINKVILQLWPYIGEYTKQFIREFIEPQVRASMPAPFKSFRFESMDMGDIPLRVGGIKVYTENVGRDRIIMDMDVMYAGDCDFVVSVGAFKGGLNQMQFSGKLRAILKPLIAYPPMVGGVSAFFLDDPTLDFNLTGLGELVELPGLMGTVRSVVISQIRSFAVLPNEIVVPLTAETDVTKLHFPEPDGVVRVHVVEAKNLENRDMSFIKKGKSDPYCHVSVGAQLFKTKVIDNNLNPRWNEFFEAVVDQASGQKLLVEVFDEDPGCNDEELGRLRLDLATIQQKGTVDTWYSLEGAKHGDLHLKLYWMQLTSDAKDLEKSVWDEKWSNAKTGLHPAMLMVYIDHISDLPYPKHNREPSPYVELTLGNETQKTFPKPNTVNPLYQQKFLFFVSDTDNQVLNVEAKDDSSGRSLGEVAVRLNILLKEQKMELYQHTWSLALQAHQSPIVMTMRLRGFRQGREDSAAEGTEALIEQKATSKENCSASPVSLLAEPGFVIDGTADGGTVYRSGNGEHSYIQRSGESQMSEESTVSQSTKLRRHPSLLGRLTNKRHSKRRESRSIIPPGELGRVQLTIRYSFQRDKLVVVVNQAEKLRPISTDMMANPYVKVKLFKDGTITEKHKTSPVLETLNPVFDETFEFDVHHSALQSYSLLINVKDSCNYGLFSRPPIMGLLVYSLQNFREDNSVTEWFDLKAA